MLKKKLDLSFTNNNKINSKIIAIVKIITNKNATTNNNDNNNTLPN